MAKLKRTFEEGRMNLDLDDRWVQPGSYRFAQNVSISKSDGPDVGALENVRGNRQLPPTFPVSSSSVCIGSVADELNNKIYWFVVGPSREGIFEYDLNTNTTNRVLEFSRDKQVFKFNTEFFITGANVIGDLLFWTDGVNPPRKIDISRYVSVSREVVVEAGLTQTIQEGAGSYYIPNNQRQYHANDVLAQDASEFGNAGNPATTTGQTVFPIIIPAGADEFEVTTVMVGEDTLADTDYTVSRQTITLSTGLVANNTFVRIAYGYRTQEASPLAGPNDDEARLISSVDPQYDNIGVALVNLETTQLTNISQQPAFHGDLINVAKRPPLFAPQVVTPSQRVQAPSAMTTQSITADGVVSVFGLDNGIDLDDPQVTITIGGVEQTVANSTTNPTAGFSFSTVQGFNNSITSVGTVLASGTVISVTYNAIQSFDASQSPAQHGEYLYNNFVYFAYRYKYRNGEVTALSPFSGPAFFPKSFESDRENGAIISMVNQLSTARIAYDVGDIEVVEVELVVTSSSDITLKSLATINKTEQGLDSSTPYQRNIQLFTYDNNKVYSTISSTELARIYDNVPLTAKAQEIIGNRLVYGNYVQNYNLAKNDGNGAIIVPNFSVDYTSVPSTASEVMPSCSVKSDRDYQVGIVYLDFEGRQTPVLLGDSGGGNSTIHIPFNDPLKAGITHTNRNTLNIDISSPAPYWATHYRFFIKQVQGQYYNVLPKRAIRVADKVYLQLAGNDRNKVGADSQLVLKGNATGIRDTRSLWRIDPYIQNGDDSGFSVSPDGDGGFAINQNIDGLVSFNIPFDEVNERVNQAFAAPTEAIGADIFMWVSSMNEFTLSRESGVDNVTNIVVTSITLSDSTVLTPNTDYSVSSNKVFIHGSADRGMFTVNYTYNTPDLESPARDDFYVAVVAADETNSNLIATGEGDLETIFETVPALESVADIYYEHGETFRCVNGAHTTANEEVVMSNDRVQEVYRSDDTIPADKTIGDPVDGDLGITKVSISKYFNCFAYPTGVEETTIEGKFNEVSLRPGIRASTVNEAYRRQENESLLIHSGIYRDDTNLNRLNQFPVGQTISKEIDIADGSIQKLYAWNTNLVVLQEDKVKNVPIQKNLIQTAGGQIALTRDSQFFGTESSLPGEYGISRNPESFQAYGNILFWADKNRGALCQYTGQSIVEISQAGAESYTRERIAAADLIIGHYDYFYDQAHFSFRNRPDPLLLSDVTQTVLISEDGRPGPRSECNRNEEFIRFKQFFMFQSNPSVGIQTGDAVYLDAGALTQFNGNYRWFRIQDDIGTLPDIYNRAIQISPFGVITGVEGDCESNQPRDKPRDVFNISAEGFATEYDACSNGVIDMLAYHNGAANEPIIGNVIFEGRYDDIQSSRTGWYIISVGLAKSVLELCNGQVMSILSCDAISAGRRAILGSNAQNIPAGTQQAQLLDDVCTEPFAEQVYWYASGGDLPVIGEVLYTNNHNDTLAIADRYYTFPDGFYARLDSDSKIELLESCSEKICFTNPSELLTQSLDNPFEFTFNGIERTYAFTTAGNTVTEFNSTRAINNVEIEYTVQGEGLYPTSGTFIINAQRTNDTTFYDFRISDENKTEILDGDVVLPLVLGSVGTGGAFTPETFILPTPNDSTSLSEAPYPSYTNEDSDVVPIQVNVTSLCYRIGNATGTSQAWVSSTSGATGATCGSTVSDAVYYDAEASRQYFEDAELTIAWTSSKGDGTFGVSYVDPSQAEGGGVVSEISTITANGTVTSSFRCVLNNPTFIVPLGFTTSPATTPQQNACNVAEVMGDTQVTVYADQDRGNFDDDDANDPPTVFKNANGTNVPDGFYTDGIVIREVIAGVVGPQELQGCGLALTAQLDVTQTVTGGTAGVVIRTDQGTTATWVPGTTTTLTLEDTGDVGDMWNFTVTITPPSGQVFAGNGPFVSVDGATPPSGGSSGNETWTGEFITDHDPLVPGSEPERTLHITGILEAAPVTPTTYSASLSASEGITGASVSFSNRSGGHSWSQSGSVYSASGIPTAQTGVVRATIGLDSGREWVTGPFVNGFNTGSSSFDFAYSTNSRTNSVAFTGTTRVTPTTRDFSISGTSGTTLATVTGESKTLSSGGSDTLTATLAAVDGWRLISHSPGATTQSVNIAYADSTRGYTRNWTSVVVNRHSHSVIEVSSAGTSDACPTGGSATTIHTSSSTAFNGTLFSSSTGTTAVTATRFFFVSNAGGGTVYTWNNGSFSSTSCTTAVPEPVAWRGVAFQTGSSALGACDSTGSGAALFVDPADSTHYATSSDGTGNINRLIYYAIGNTVYTFSSTNIATTSLCDGVYVGGTRFASGGNITTTTGTRRTGTVVVVGVRATFEPRGGAFSPGESRNNRGWDATANVGGTRMTSTEAFFAGENPNVDDLIFSFSPSSTSRGDGSYAFSLGVTFTNLGGGANIQVTY